MARIDIVIGIPSYCEADNIAFVARQCSLGLARYYPKKKAVIVNVDNDSPDKTKEAFLRAKTRIPKEYISTSPGVVGKGNNFRNLFSYCEKKEAVAGMVIDADLRSITPQWVNHLLSPIFAGHDYVSPAYSRHRYDGTITNNICYPTVYGVFGIDMRQPIGGDFAFSGKLARYWNHKRWEESTRQYGIDIFMTTHAIFGGFRLATTGLGSKIHKPSAPKLGAMFSQVVRTLFSITIMKRNVWMKTSSVRKLEHYGLADLGPPQDLTVDSKTLEAKALDRYQEYRFIIKECLSKRSFEAIDKMARNKEFRLGSELWTTAYYDLITAFSRTDDKFGVIEAAKPLYFMRCASFIRETRRIGDTQAEQLIKEQAEEFWRRRPYLERNLKHLDN